MTEVTDISEARKKKRGDLGDYFWHCPTCDNSVFWVLVDGTLICTNCECYCEPATEE